LVIFEKQEQEKKYKNSRFSNKNTKLSKNNHLRRKFFVRELVITQFSEIKLKKFVMKNSDKKYKKSLLLPRTSFPLRNDNLKTESDIRGI